MDHNDDTSVGADGPIRPQRTATTQRRPTTINVDRDGRTNAIGDAVMPYDPDRHHRRSIRLRGYDYSQAGAYFVTVCVQQRECLFGEVESEVVRLNDSG